MPTAVQLPRRRRWRTRRPSHLHAFASLDLTPGSTTSCVMSYIDVNPRSLVTPSNTRISPLDVRLRSAHPDGSSKQAGRDPETEHDEGGTETDQRGEAER